MIIVPNISSKTHLEKIVPSRPVLLLSQYLTILLHQTPWETAHTTIIDHYLLKKVNISQLSMVKQHISHLLEYRLHLDDLTISSHPNSAWIAGLASYLFQQLEQHQCVHPHAIIDTLIKYDVTIEHPEVSHYGFSVMNPNIEQFFALFNIKEHLLETPDTQAYQQSFDSVEAEIQCALAWQKATPNSAIVCLNPHYETWLERCVASSDATSLEWIKAITAPHSTLPYQIIPHLYYSQQFPEGFAIKGLLPLEQHPFDHAREIATVIAWVGDCDKHSSEPISIESFHRYIRTQLAFWRVRQNTCQAVEQQIKKLYPLSFLDVKLDYKQWHERFKTLTLPSSMPVYILTPEQALGARFEQLWVLGAAEEKWRSVSQLAGFAPEHQSSTDYLSLANLPETLICSHQLTGDSGEALAIPTSISAATLDFSIPKNNITLNLWQDTLHAADELKGGVSLIQDYATCPFKAFSRHRLKINRKRVSSHDIQPHHYGTLVHDVLEMLYQDIPSQDALHTLPTDQIKDHILSAWAHSRHRHTLHPTLIEILKDKMYQTITAWIETDKNREPFLIKALETKKVLAIGDYQINIRIDRIDEVNQQTVMVDYKTGKANIIDTFKPDFTHPQMALYALTTEQPAILAYGKVLHQNVQWQGLDLACEQSLQKGQEARHADTQTYLELRQRWQQQALDCLNHYMSGIYPVKPVNTQACDLCDFKSFCRVYDQGVYT